MSHIQAYLTSLSSSKSCKSTNFFRSQLTSGNSGGPAGFVYGFLFVWAGSLATYASLGELASMSYPPRALYDLSLRSRQGPNRRWPISLGSNARSTRVTQNSQLYDWYSQHRLSTQTIQLISCRLAYCYWLASRICHCQPRLSSTYSRLNCLGSTGLRP